MTKYELQIYNIVNQARNHMTAEQVFFKLREIYPSVSLATVYNNLNKLCEAGLLRGYPWRALPKDTTAQPGTTISSAKNAAGSQTFSLTI